MPRSRATARSDNAAAPSAASWVRAMSVISRVISALTRSRAVWRGGIARAYQSGRHKQEHCSERARPTDHRDDGLGGVAGSRKRYLRYKSVQFSMAVTEAF